MFCGTQQQLTIHKSSDRHNLMGDRVISPTVRAISTSNSGRNDRGHPLALVYYSNLQFKQSQLFLTTICVPTEYYESEQYSILPGLEGSVWSPLMFEVVTAEDMVTCQMQCHFHPACSLSVHISEDLCYLGNRTNQASIITGNVGVANVSAIDGRNIAKIRH